MAAQQLLLLQGGVRTSKSSAGLVVDFQGVNIGADALPIVQGGTGAAAYFDFGARAVRTGFSPTNANDLVNLQYFNQNSQKIVSWQNAALDIVAAPPGSPNTGDRYLIAASGTSGVFAGHENALADYTGSGWTYTSPVKGTFVDVLTYTSGVYFYNGSAWGQKDFEATTASKGVKLVGRDIQRDDAKSYTNDNAAAITVGQFVYVKANGNVDLASASVANLPNFAIGCVQDASIAAAAAGNVVVRPGAVISGFSGLTPGGQYFIAKATAGTIALIGNITLASGDTLYHVGRAVSATELLFNPGYEYVVG